jgi:LacI family transcriptional regulator
MDVTRTGLIDHSVTVVISHPLGRLAAQAISNMVRATANLEDTRNQTEILPFEIFTSENV